MPDAEFVFKIIEEGGGAAGAAGTPAGKGGDPTASPQPSQRTQARDTAELQGGGAGPIIQQAQEQRNTARDRRVTKAEKQFQRPVVGAEVVKGRVQEQAERFGAAFAQRIGFGGIAGAIGTAALPLAIATAGAGAAVAVVRAGQAVARAQTELAKQLRPFSPELAVSAARENLRRVTQNIELARRIGPSLAESERQRGRFGAAQVEFGAQVAAGPVGQEVTAITKLGADILEATNRFSELVSPFLPPGPATAAGNLLQRLGIEPVDRFKDIKGSLFRDFPHAEVKIFPKELGARDVRDAPSAAAFTTDQDRILNQF